MGLLYPLLRLLIRLDGSDLLLSAGRSPALELEDGARTADRIHQGEIALLQEAIERGGAHGMQTLDQSLYNLHLQGHINAETALEYAAAPRAMRLRLRLEGLAPAE